MSSFQLQCGWNMSEWISRFDVNLLVYQVKGKVKGKMYVI